MAALRDDLIHEFGDVLASIQSATVVLRSDLPTADVARTIEERLPRVDLAGTLVRALSLGPDASESAPTRSGRTFPCTPGRRSRGG